MTYVIGDIHGNYKALKEVFKACSFNYDSDELIILGDVVDGHSQTKECVDLLLKIKNKIFILGNHDHWFIQWLDSGDITPGWYNQGGKATLESYGIKVTGNGELILDVSVVNTDITIPVTHQEFFNSWKPYYIDNENRLFVHGGFRYANPRIPLRQQELSDLIWDRDLIDRARGHWIKGYSHIFVGHTSTIAKFGSDYKIQDCSIPLTFNNLTMMDTGGGWSGKISIMDVDTHEYWQSKKSKGGR